MISEWIATPLVLRAVLVALAAILVQRAAAFAGIPAVTPARNLVDFDAFHIAGQMAWRGDIADAYELAKLMKAQVALGGRSAAMPWTYPPPFDLLAAGLALLPVWLAYLLFVGSTLAAFLAVLRRLAGAALPAVVIAVFPALITTIASGQNGFLTGMLLGLTCLGLMAGRAAAGLPLGLMVIKPHLAVTVALFVIATRRWACALVAAVVVLGSAGLATLVFGPAIWPAFLHGVREAGEFLVAGYYPMFRMVSVYATLRSLDLSASLAMLAQAVSALAALGVVAGSIRAGMPTRQILGMTALSGLMVSPYVYDYDLSLYAVALALLMPDLLRRTSGREQVALAALSWTICGFGLVSTIAAPLLAPGAPVSTVGAADGPAPPSVVAPLLLLTTMFVWRILRRGGTRDRARSAPGRALSQPA